MAIYKRLPRGKKKRTGELATFAERAYVWVMVNWRTVVAGAAFVILISMSAIGVYQYHHWKEDRGAQALAEASAREGMARIDALTMVATEYVRTAAGREAMIILGNAAVKLGRANDALHWFAETSDHVRGYPLLATYALHQQGHLHAQANAWEDAAQAFHHAAGLKGNVIRARSTYEEARCLEELKKYDDARTLYENVVATSDETAQDVKALSEERLLWLAAQRHIQQSS